MKFLFTIFCFLFCVAVYAQDSTKQKHSLFKLSGVSMLYGPITNINETYISKQDVIRICPDIANQPFSNYPSVNTYGYGGSGVSTRFGAYVSISSYNKKKKRYSIYTHTNIGVSVFTNVFSLYSNFIGITSSRMDTLYVKLGSNNYYPSSYRDMVTTNNAEISYNSTNVGLDVQQMFTTNEKKILSFFVGIGALANISVISQISYQQYQETSINVTSNPNQIYIYNPNTYYNPSNSPPTYISSGTYNVKNSVFYQIYVPFGFNIRLGKNDKKVISHLYLTTQARIGVQILKVASANAFVSSTAYAIFGIKYKF